MASCLGDENEILLKVNASFSASRFALPSIPLTVLHSLVRSVCVLVHGFNKVSPFCLHTDTVLDVFSADLDLLASVVARQFHLV